MKTLLRKINCLWFLITIVFIGRYIITYFIMACACVYEILFFRLLGSCRKRCQVYFRKANFENLQIRNPINKSFGNEVIF